jgi:hypothetical protein
MLSVILPSVVMPKMFIFTQYHGECQFFSLHCMVMLSVIMLSVVVLSVVVLGVVLSVVVPYDFYFH